MLRTGSPVIPNKIGHGLFMVVEGADGTGKSTLTRALGEELTRLGVPNTITREPTRDLTFGKILVESRNNRFTPLEEYWLFMLDRAQHNREVVRPAIMRGEVVVSDRHMLSTLVYQAPRMVSAEELPELEARIHAECVGIGQMPDVTVVLDVPPEVAWTRIRESRGGAGDGYETLELISEYRGRYLELSRRFGFTVLDGTRPTHDLVSELARLFVT